MPVYSIKAPDGKTYRVEGPEGATGDQVRAEVLRQNPSAGRAAQTRVERRQEKERTWGDTLSGMARQLGRGVADVPDILATAGHYLQPSRLVDAALGTNLTPEAPRPFANIAVDKVADAFGAGRTEQGGRAERIVGEGVRGLGAAAVPIPGLSAARGARAAERVAGALSGSVAQAVEEAGGGVLAQTAAGLGAGMLPGLRRARPPGTPRREAREAAEAARRLKVDVGTGQITGSNALARATDASANAFLGGSLNRAARHTEQQLGNAVDDVASDIGQGRSKYQVGRTAERAVNRDGGFVNRFQDKADELYTRVDAHAPRDIDVTDTLMSMIRIPNNFFNNPKLGARLANTKLIGMAQDIAQNKQNPGRLAFKEAQALRSEVGRMMGDSALVNDIPRAELANVYRALTGDMRKGLVETGSGEGVRAFDRASQYYSAGSGRLEKLEQILGSASSAEQIADRIAGMGRKDSAGVYQLRRSTTPEEWDDIASGVFRQMGEPSPGAADQLGEGFSPSRFLTNFNKIQQNNRGFNAMFGGTRYAGVQDRLRDLAAISDRLKDNARLMNHSGSGHVNSLLGLIGIGYLSPQTAAGLGAGNFVFSNLMASPRFLRAQIRAANAMEAATRGGPPAIEAAARVQLARLNALMSEEQER